MKNPLKKNKKVETEQTLLLNTALTKLVEKDIVTIVDGKYTYSKSFVKTVNDIANKPLSFRKQASYGRKAGHKLTAQLIALTGQKPSVTDIKNLITAFTVLSEHIKRNNINVNKNHIPDLSYAIWYLNDHEATVEEMKEWNLI